MKTLALGSDSSQSISIKRARNQPVVGCHRHCEVESKRQSSRWLPGCQSLHGLRQLRCGGPIWPVSHVFCLGEELEGEKRAVFLSTCGLDVFKMARTLIALLAVEHTPWPTLTEKLKTHHALRPPCSASQHAFYHHNEKDTKTIGKCTTVLHRAAMNCELRDREGA